MFSIRKINPMARAVGTMGAVAALVGGVTFAALQSNTVALTPNTLTTGSAKLAIADTNCTTDTTTTNTAGFNNVKLVPGTPVSVNFCLVNTGDVPLTMFSIIPQDLSGSAAAASTDLKVTCGTIGTAEGNLNTWSSYKQFDGSSLGAGDAVACTASATLSNSYNGSGGESIPAFSVNFVGNEVSAT
jgi:hypothetical protein